MGTPTRTRVSAYALATTADQLLLTLLSDASPVFAPGLWHLPGGGIDPGEQPQQALAREVYEETGLELLDARRWTPGATRPSDSACAGTWWASSTS